MSDKKQVYRPPMRERVATRLRDDAESSARVGDRSVRTGSWRLANVAYALARDLNTAARQVELNLAVSIQYRPMVKEAQEKEA